MTRAALLLLILAAGLRPLAAQSIPQAKPTPPLVKYGKWGLLTASVAMNILAARAHDRADRQFATIEQICSTEDQRCTALPNGRYADPQLEAIYQRTLRYDHLSRNWIIAGESALVGSALLFIWEFSRPKGSPANIPFAPQVTSSRYGTQVGLTWEF